MSDLNPELPVPEGELQAELERNVFLLKQLSNMYHCFGLRKHSVTIDRTVRKVERGMRNIRNVGELDDTDDVCNR